MANDQTPGERLYAIVEQGLCIGCGLCQTVAGRDRVRVAKTLNGYLQPVVEGRLDQETVDRIYAVCPGTSIEGLPERLVDADTRHDNVWGPWRRIVRAWAADPQVRFEGSTGGVLTALADYLLVSKRVDFILHVKASATEPSFGDATLSYSSADVLEAAGSRYGPAAPLVDIGEVLARGRPFAFIAKPCDVTALRNYARQDERVDRLVRYWLVMVCGGYGTPQGTVDFYRRAGIEPEQVTGLRYRGRGCPGPTRVETADGKAREFHYIDFWGEDETTWTLPFRCKICPDGIGEAADIAAADTWIGGGPNRVDSVDDPGTNALIARTRAGEELLAAAAADGALTIEYDIVPDILSAYQPHQVNKKY
ncbi:MAG: Coenzyme F420 hydrogenase/dehydrogenase, beta subunit C-terminal domain, partial [Gammaproteobacteria bacterium]|nr:Coenzyme F420 hydrogenase/dehydrogenase, beta subunit C-terminal domain [Gammaproteobacteria bacterium]